MTVTVPAEISKHIGAYVGAAVAAVALVVAIVLGMAIADSDSTPAVGRSTVQQELPTRFGEGSPDAIEHRAVNDPVRYGSPDAAEEWNR